MNYAERKEKNKERRMFVQQKQKELAEEAARLYLQTSSGTLQQIINMVDTPTLAAAIIERATDPETIYVSIMKNKGYLGPTLAQITKTLYERYKQGDWLSVDDPNCMHSYRVKMVAEYLNDNQALYDDIPNAS